MNNDKAKAQSIFNSAVEEHAPDQWDTFLGHACGDDVALRRRVEILLKGHQGEDSFLDRGNIDEADATVDRQLAEGPGTVIGPYRLLQQIGEGGFGVVFLSEQERPVRRRVALKVIKPGMDTRQVIARFEAERQALAMMDHPNIAKVLDAGTTGARSREQGAGSPEEFLLHAPCSPLPASSGRPYFVMELVQGVPITEYCDQCNLTTRERLELFITVCQAVQHAHQKGIIHRDLKPTNVLVAIQDGQPAPKIIDFGVAKAINQPLTEHTRLTAFAQMVGTPLYMSPEQAELSPLGVDTRSDIYSLGVLLYELLTGTTPFEKDRLHAAPYDELRRIIREEDPPRPSARISTLAADKASTVALHRRTDRRRLSQQVRGELDWIVMKCLEKDRNRRYETPNSMARDIERYLHNEPVQACPPSKAYRLRKYARRNKVAIGFVALLATGAIFLGLSNLAMKRERDAKIEALAQATTESARATAVSDLLQEMLGSADAARAKGVDYKVRDLLDDFAAGLGSQLTDQREVESDIHATIGRAYRSLKLPEKAQPHFEKAIELRRHSDDTQSEKLAAIFVDGAWNLQDLQRHAEAESQVHEALKIYRRRGVTGGPLFHALEVLQHVLINAGRDADAERVTQDALAVARQSGREFADQANLLHRYADMKIRQGHFVEGETLASQAVEMHRRLHGDRHPETAFGLRTLARAFAPQQKLVEAEAVDREALVVFRHQFPESHPNIRESMYHLRTVLEARDDKAALEALAKEEAEIEMRSNSPDYRIRLAGALLANTSQQRRDEARQLIRHAINEYAQVAVDYPNDLDRRANALVHCARALWPSAAVPGFEDEVSEVNRHMEVELPKLLIDFPDSNDSQWRTAVTYREWGNALFNCSAYLSVAEHAMSEAEKVLGKLSQSDPKRPRLWPQLADTYSVLGEIRWRLARLPEADAAFRRAMEIHDEHAAEIATASDAPGFIVVSCQRMAYFLAATHREEEAAKVARRAAHAAEQMKTPLEKLYVNHLIAFAQLRAGDEAGYRATCKALAEVPVDDVDDLMKARQILTFCFAPDSLEDMDLVVERAEELAKHNQVDEPHVVPYALGAALYRDGQYDRAAEQLEKSIAAYPSDPWIDCATINLQRLFLAMSKWQLDKKDDARRLLAETKPAIDQDLQSPSVFYVLKATLEVLRREAETLIKPKDAVEAVENKSRTNDE